MVPVSLAFALLFLVRPASWLWIVPALLPVVDLAPWTGWIHFTESDALVLAVVAGVGLREALKPAPNAATPRAFQAGPVALLLFLLVAISYGVSAWRTPIPLPPYDPSLFASYKTPLNGVRLLKGFVLAVALLPALHSAGRSLGQRAPGRLGWGLAIGLALAALAATWERFAFPGLLNFSADYRTTGLFWDMHVGGAALDGWLALTLPFAVAGFLGATDLRHRAAFLGIIGVAAYAILTTFSRGLYGGVAVGMAMLLVASYRSAPPATDARAGNSLRGGAWIGALALFAMAPSTFAGGGYRGLAAFLGFAGLVYLNTGRDSGISRRISLTAMTLGVGIGALASAFATYLPKGPYVVFASLFIVALAHGVVSLRSPASGRAALMLALTAAAGVTAGNVGLYWGEGHGSMGIVMAVGVGLAVMIWHVGIRPMWHASPRGATNLVLVLGVAGSVATGLGSYYMGERFSTTSADLDGRIAHWQEGARLVRTPMDAAFGIGLGRYPDAYYWSGPLASNAGSWQLLEDDGNRYSRLGATRSVLGFGELFRISQQVPGNTLGPFHYRMRVRAPSKSSLHLEVCRKHLLYANRCAIKEFRIESPGWTEISGTTDAGSLTLGRGLDWQPSVFSLAVSGRAPVDIDDVEVIDDQARSIVANGDFESGVDDWFFSSDRHHLPWHAKSLPLHVWIEQGWLGVLAIGGTLLAALSRVAFGRVRHHKLAPALLAGLSGFLVVGLFDSLLDMPRMTLSMFLLSWVALTLTPRPASTMRRHPA